MDPKEIKIEFIRRGLSQTHVAKKIGVSPSMVQRVIAQKVVSRPVAQGIADALDLPLEVVFSKYAAAGSDAQCVAACS